MLRGHLANPWDLRAFEDMGDEWRVSVPVMRSGAYDPSSLRLDMPRALALSDLAPRRLRERAAPLRAQPLPRLCEGLSPGADVVHALELAFWFTAQAGRLKDRLGFRLVVTVWETIPFLEAYRHPLANRLRRDVLASADLYLAATERAREGLLLEGVSDERVTLCPPGIDVDAFAAARGARPEEHVVVSPGRLVWTKGHQDVLRAVAALRRGLVRAPARASGPHRRGGPTGGAASGTRG